MKEPHYNNDFNAFTFYILVAGKTLKKKEKIIVQ